MNSFADLTRSELVAHFTGYKKAKGHHLRERRLANLTAPSPRPSSIDWRVKGAITPVKNQVGQL